MHSNMENKGAGFSKPVKLLAAAVSMHPNIQNKVAVITGGSRGIGFRIAEMLVQNGAYAVICSRQQGAVRRATEALNKLVASRAEGMAADVRNYHQVERLMALAEETFGGIDILVNNAGVGIFGPVDQIMPQEWDAVIGTNLRAVSIVSAPPFLA